MNRDRATLMRNETRERRPSGRSRELGQSGQSAVELMMCIIVFFFFLFFMLSFSILLVTGSYIDYATFMAARTYKSGYDTQATKLQNAQQVFNSYTSKVQGIARNIQLGLPADTDPKNPSTAGFVASYEINLFYMPPVFITGDNFQNMSLIHLTSEAHLGSDPGLGDPQSLDPNSNDCFNYFARFLSSNGFGSDPNLIQEMDDNGC